MFTCSDFVDLVLSLLFVPLLWTSGQRCQTVSLWSVFMIASLHGVFYIENCPDSLWFSHVSRPVYLICFVQTDAASITELERIWSRAKSRLWDVLRCCWWNQKPCGRDHLQLMWCSYNAMHIAGTRRHGSYSICDILASFLHRGWRYRRITSSPHLTLHKKASKCYFPKCWTVSLSLHLS